MPHDPACPFCPGNESQTPPPIFTLPCSDAKNNSDWDLRVIPNKYPALTPDALPIDSDSSAILGMGRHEVIIETPLHNGLFGSYSDETVFKFVRVLRDRMRALNQIPNIETVIFFRNDGPKAGISLSHPHSQIVAMPLTPTSLLQRMEILDDHFNKQGQCLICQFIYDEIEQGQRVVSNQNGFLTFHPYASRMPYETWVAPTVHLPRFENLDDAQCAGFAKQIRNAVGTLQRLIPNLDFNLMLINGADAFDPEDRFHFFARIVPRLSHIAGFELATDTYMNSHCPEQTAKQIRAELTKQGKE